MTSLKLKAKEPHIILPFVLSKECYLVPPPCQICWVAAAGEVLKLTKSFWGQCYKSYPNKCSFRREVDITGYTDCSNWAEDHSAVFLPGKRIGFGYNSNSACTFKPKVMGYSSSCVMEESYNSEIIIHTKWVEIDAETLLVSKGVQRVNVGVPHSTSAWSDGEDYHSWTERKVSRNHFT